MKKYSLWLTVVLLGAGLFWGLVSGGNTSTPSAGGASLDPAMAARISLHYAGRADVLLTLDEDRVWTLQPENHPADAEAVQHLLQNLAAMQVVRVVAHHHAHDASLALDEAQAIGLSVQDKQGKVLLRMQIGKSATDMLSTYVRIDEQEEVLAVDQALVWQVRRMRDAWLAPRKVLSENKT